MPTCESYKFWRSRFLYDHLRRQILVEKEALVRKEETVGKILQDAIREEAFDLLVMGSYSRLHWFEVIFGGMTESALLESSIPLLSSH